MVNPSPDVIGRDFNISREDEGEENSTGGLYISNSIYIRFNILLQFNVVVIRPATIPQLKQCLGEC
jgi:hypothetical protein